MSGTPLKKLKQQVEALAEATTRGVTPRAPARAPARDTVPQPAPATPAAQPVPAPVPLGVSQLLRNVGDGPIADELRQLANVLAPGVAVRIERLKPQWAGGYLEEYTCTSANIAELFDHLRTEYGGRQYRLTTLYPNGAPAFSARVDVYGPPLHEGKSINRDELDGIRPAPAAQPIVLPNKPRHEPENPMAQMAPMLSFVQLFVDMMQRSSDASLQAVRELSERSAAQNQGLIQALAERGTQEARGGSLVGQLGELMESARAIEQVKKSFGAAAPSAAGGEDGLLAGAAKEAAKHFITSAMASQFGGAAPQRGNPARTAPAQRQAPNPPATVLRSVPSRAQPSPRDDGGIPEAV